MPTFILCMSVFNFSKIWILLCFWSFCSVMIFSVVLSNDSWILVSLASIHSSSFAYSLGLTTKMYLKFISLRSIFINMSLKSDRMLIFSFLADCSFYWITVEKMSPMIAMSMFMNVICRRKVMTTKMIHSKYWFSSPSNSFVQKSPRLSFQE